MGCQVTLEEIPLKVQFTSNPFTLFPVGSPDEVDIFRPMERVDHSWDCLPNFYWNKVISGSVTYLVYLVIDMKKKKASLTAPAQEPLGVRQWLQEYGEV